jgi:hypothetical protein
MDIESKTVIEILQTDKWVQFESCDLHEVPYRMRNIEQYHLGNNGWKAARAINNGCVVQLAYA